MEDDDILSLIDEALRSKGGKMDEEARVLVASELKNKAKGAEVDPLLKHIDEMLAGQQNLSEAERVALAKRIKLETEEEDLFESLLKVKGKADQEEQELNDLLRELEGQRYKERAPSFECKNLSARQCANEQMRCKLRSVAGEPKCVSRSFKDVEKLLEMKKLLEEPEEKLQEITATFEEPVRCGLLTKDKCQEVKDKCEWDEKERECYDLPPTGVELAPQIEWPSRDGNNFAHFTLKYFNAAKDAVNLLDTSVRYCENDEFNPDKFSTDTPPSAEQQLAVKMIAPTTPYTGALLYHEVGTGKTRLGLRILSNFRQSLAQDVRLIWITTIRAEKSIHSQTSDFPSFAGAFDPFVPGPSATARSHAAGKIAIFTYIKFVNALHRLYDLDGEKNEYGNVLKERQKQTGDAFSNTIIILDEAHKIFEDKNGAGAGQYLIERAAYESHAAAKVNGTQACRWVFLTATPMPTIELPTDERKPELAGGPQAAFRLLNMLIPDKLQRLPIDHSGIQKMKAEFKKEVPDNFASLTGKEYAERAKGLVGYFKPNWPNVFANVEGENSLTVVKIDDKQVDKIKVKLAQTCGPVIAKRDPIKIAKCYLRRLHWYGMQLGPKSAEARSASKKKGKLPKGGLPGDLASKCTTKDHCVVGPDGKLNVLNIPRAKTLYDTILAADAADMAKYGKKFKHVIYSGMKNYTADMYASALVLASNEDPTNKTKIIYQEPLDRYKDIGLEYKSRDETIVVDEKVRVEKKFYLDGEMDKGKALEHDVLFFKQDDLSDKQVETMLKGFNDNKRNAYGEIARFIVLGAGSKEALSLFNVKYVHIMEQPLTSTDKTQIIGRARRYCSHIGLPNEARRITVNIYGLELPQKVLNLRAQSHEDQDLETAELSKIAQSVIKTDETLSKQLEAREKILNWMRIAAFDSLVVGMANEEQVKGKIQEAERDLEAADKSKAAIEAFNVRRYTQLEKKKSKLTVAQLKAECKIKGVKLPAKAKKDQLLHCCGSNVVPADCGRVSVGAAATAVAAPPPVKRKRGAYTAKQLKEMCKTRSIPVRSNITRIAKLEECCGPTVTMENAAARDCISGAQLKKLGMPAMNLPPIVPKPIHLPPIAPKPISLPKAPVAPAPPKVRNISAQERQLLKAMCPNREFYANQIENKVTRAKFLEMCDQVAKGL